MNSFIKKASISLAGICLAATIVGATAFAATKSTNTSATISREKAISIAQEKASGTLLKAELDRENGVLVYEIDILDSSQKKHDIDINASTGQIVSYKQKSYSKSKASQYTSAKITHDKAISIATTETGAKNVTSSKLDVEDGRLVYELTLRDDQYTEYEVVIDATTGSILSTDVDYDD